MIRFRSGEIDYLNSDATWHELLTIECYDETPISQHLFLPIISMGDADDKWITWGATIPDSEGNYYYTSFSAASFFLGWLFLKIFHLPVSEMGLYIWNNVLLVISAVLLMRLLAIVYRNSRFKELLCLIGSISYIWLPEILHGLGIVYWSQSVMQATLLMQIIFWYKHVYMDSRSSGILFLAMTVVNPYIEWTGYVANVGFAIAEILSHRKDLKRGFRNAFQIGMLTVVSFGLFCLHYLLRVDRQAFFKALRDRFMARNVTTETLLTDVFGGYLKSFLFLWLLLLILVIWCMICKKQLEIGNGLLLFVLSFPIMENVVMKQHALAYTYDRMKAAFVLIFLVCEISRNLLENNDKANIKAGIVALTALIAVMNLFSYVNDKRYIWQVDYRERNQILADYVTEQYPDAVYICDSVIRGYMNLLYGRGIYEYKGIDQGWEIAVQKGKKQVISMSKEGYKLTNVSVMDVTSKEIMELEVRDGNVVRRIHGAIQTADFTDDNWINGVSRRSNILLFNRNDSLLIDFLTGDSIAVGDKVFKIQTVDYDDLWIRVGFSENVSVCQYPAEIAIRGMN